MNTTARFPQARSIRSSRGTPSVSRNRIRSARRAMASMRVASVSGYQRDRTPLPFSPLRVNEAPFARIPASPGSVQHQRAEAMIKHVLRCCLFDFPGTGPGWSEVAYPVGQGFAFTKYSVPESRDIAIDFRHDGLIGISFHHRGQGNDATPGGKARSGLPDAGRGCQAIP